MDPHIDPSEEHIKNDLLHGARIAGELSKALKAYVDVNPNICISSFVIGSQMFAEHIRMTLIKSGMTIGPVEVRDTVIKDVAETLELEAQYGHNFRPDVAASPGPDDKQIQPPTAPPPDASDAPWTV